MNRLVVRLIASHAIVAIVGAAATYLIVRQLAPNLFDQSMMQGGGGPMMGQYQGQGPTLRQQFADAVDQALLVGTLVGAAAAALFGSLAAFGLVRPINHLRAATRVLASGRYADPVPVPRERELAELVADVNTLGEALAETETRRVRLLGEVAHEMRTPLTVIDGYVEAMIDGMLPANAEKLGEVSEEVRRLRRLSESLSALSRAEEGRLDLDLAPADLAEIATGAAERLRPQAEDAGVRLELRTGDASLPAQVDRDRIAQVVTNLVGNAIRSTPSGGRVSVSCRQEHHWAVVEVADTGEGLAAEDLERVFERFYRVAGARRPAHDTGAGIGLTIARGIVRAHGGELVARSEGRGRGAVFTARVPLAQH
ncbi:MAG TPA: HAMP domain-containing sensor histidine kinase [Marmoricola sp.]|nr:HAMP domain-containing sensor histidine kinase [Marmoricola sp.]